MRAVFRTESILCAAIKFILPRISSGMSSRSFFVLLRDNDRLYTGTVRRERFFPLSRLSEGLFRAELSRPSLRHRGGQAPRIRLRQQPLRLLCRQTVRPSASRPAVHEYVYPGFIKAVIYMQLFRRRTHIADRCHCRFFHDVAEISGKLNFAAALHDIYLNRERISADACPCKTAHYSDFVFFYSSCQSQTQAY